MGHPDWFRLAGAQDGPAVLSIPLIDPEWKNRPPLVIPSAAEGPAVLRNSRGNALVG
jgi:hypothetical protein